MNAFTIPIEYMENSHSDINIIEQGRRLRRRFHHTIDLKAGACDELLLKRLAAIVETHLTDESFDVGRLAAEIGLCRRQLHRKLRALIDQSPGRFIRMLRLRRHLWSGIAWGKAIRILRPRKTWGQKNRDPSFKTGREWLGRPVRFRSGTHLKHSARPGRMAMMVVSVQNLGAHNRIV